MTTDTINLGSLSADQQKAVAALVSAQINPVKEALEKLTPTIAGLANLKGELTAHFDQQIAKAIEPLKTAPPAAPKKEGEKEDPNAAVLASLKALTEKLEASEKERAREREERANELKARAARELTQKVIEAKYPNLKGRDVVIGRIAASLPADEAAVLAKFEEIRKEQAAFGVDLARLTADPKAEGARDAADKNANSENDEQEKRRTEDIRTRRLDAMKR